MAEAIFTTTKVKKSELYPAIINAFLSAGWENVSSSAADFDVLRSTGESGDKNLVIQLRPTNTTNVNSIKETNYNVISYRLVGGYTPGDEGADGVFDRPTEAWTVLHALPTAASAVTPAETELTCLINVNKNRMIISIGTPPSIGLNPVLWYIGLPDVTWASESGSRGLLVATSTYGKTAANVHITNAPDEVASEAVSSVRPVYCQLAPKNPNSAGLYAFSEIMYGNATEGYRGKLTGIFALPNGNINNGDIINIGTNKYQVIVTQVASTTNFPSSTFAVQIG